VPGVQVTGHVCDVSDEAQVLRFRDELLERHASHHVDLVFSNAGMPSCSMIWPRRDRQERQGGSEQGTGPSRAGWTGRSAGQLGVSKLTEL
jgi:hypothetical protein